MDELKRVSSRYSRSFQQADSRLHPPSRPQILSPQLLSLPTIVTRENQQTGFDTSHLFRLGLSRLATPSDNWYNRNPYRGFALALCRTYGQREAYGCHRTRLQPRGVYKESRDICTVEEVDDALPLTVSIGTSRRPRMFAVCP